MYNSVRMRQYQQQAVLSSSPEQLIHKLYDLGIVACNQDDRSKLRAVLAELMSSLDLEQGEIAVRLQAIYEYCLIESANGDLSTIHDILTGLREAWRDGVMTLKAA